MSEIFRNLAAKYKKSKSNMTDFKQTFSEAQGWPMDKLVDYIMNNYHEGCVMRVDGMRREAEMLQTLEGAKDMELVATLLGESYEDLSNHFQKEEGILFPYICELQQTIDSGSEPQPFHCGSVQYPIRVMMMEHSGELERYDRILGIMKQQQEPFASSEPCKMLTNKIEGFVAWLGEHIKLEDEILFPRAITAEGMPTIEG
jgi:regulator of cell morphogenesis and NO signaling